LPHASSDCETKNAKETIAAELGGHLRAGLEDTFYLPDGNKVGSNAALVEMLARYAREVGRVVASPAEVRALMGLTTA
jgi:3-keto-5-aminohexanoate cleavage enzyme